MRPVRDTHEPSRQLPGGTWAPSGTDETPQRSRQDSNETTVGPWKPEGSLRPVGDLVVSSGCVPEDQCEDPARPAGDLEGGPRTRRSPIEAHRSSVLTYPTTFGIIGPRTNRDRPGVLSIGRWAHSLRLSNFSPERTGAGRGRKDSGLSPAVGQFAPRSGPRRAPDNWSEAEVVLRG